jgi:glutamate-1-semialdehyde 2,1-aminomutase
MTQSPAARAYAQFEDEYRKRTVSSLVHYEKAKARMPGGVPGSASYRVPHPLYIREAHGTHVTDLDGNEYLDLLLGGGPNILGHSHPAVMAAVAAQLPHGTNALAASELSLELAEMINRNMPHLELLRYVTTGSEAMHMAIRTARGFTGRTKIGKFEGNFHGGYDNHLVSGRVTSGSLADPVGQPDGAGIPQSIVDDTLVLPFNRTEETLALIEAHADELAAVVIEPIACTWMGGVAADLDFLQAVRAITAAKNIVLIFDEIVTGFRVSLGGWAAVTGVTPDLTALAKIIGGGFPLGAFGGRADIMDYTLSPPATAQDTRPRVFQSGTFQSNLISLTAGIATLTELEKPGVLEQVNAHGDRLRDAFVAIGAEYGLKLRGAGYGSIVGFHFADEAPKSIRDVMASDRMSVAAFCLGLVANGVFITPYHLGLTNAVQTEAHVDQVIDIARGVLATIAG